MIQRAESLVGVHTHTHGVLLEKTQSKIGQNGKKLISVLTILMLLFTYVTPFSIAVNEEPKVDEEIDISQEIQKYIPYMYSDEDQGVILQEKVKVNSKIENIKQTDITIAIPEYSTIKPETIEIRTITSEITNDTTQPRYYTTNSENTEIKITAKSNFEDEYYITYYYPKEAYDKYLDTTHVKEYPDGEIVEIKQDEETGEVYVYIDFAWDETENTGEKPDSKVLMDKTTITLKAKAEITTETDTIAKEETLDKEVILQISSQIDSEYTSDLTEISKSNLYNKKEINYETTNNINIIKSDILNQLTIEDLGTKFILEDETEKTVKEKYNSITINKNNLTKILGEEGYIRFLNESQEEITKIDLNTEVDEDGNITYNFQDEISKVNIEISGIENNGFLQIKQNKTILSNQDYSREDIKQFKKTKTTAKLDKIESYTQEIESNVEISLKETYTKAKIKINNKNLSTIDENTGIEFKIELMNNNIDSDYWENPIIVAEMPKEVEEITINSASLLYEDNLQFYTYKVDTLNGNKAIRIDLRGTQKELISSTIEGGTTIVINANIKLKELTLTNENNPINLYYFNNLATNYEEETQIELNGENYSMGKSSTEVNYVAPIGFTTIHQIRDFNTEGNIVNSANSEKEVGKIKILEPQKEANYKIILMNNTGNKATRNTSNRKCTI